MFDKLFYNLNKKAVQTNHRCATVREYGNCFTYNQSKSKIHLFYKN